MRRKTMWRYGGFFIILMIVFIFFFIIKGLIWSPASKAESVVRNFYSYEQDGNFSDSWELLHPYMKERFTKAAFIQDRAHVFIGHFGAETFSFEVGDPEEVEGWRPAKGEKPFKTTYKFIVKQDYSGKYGRFSFLQEVYVVEYKKKQVILWDYNS